MRTKLLVVLVAALALSALLLAGGASAQRNARQGSDNASGAAKSKRVVGVRSSDDSNGSRVTITADDTLKDYSAYRSGDRFYVVLPKAAAGARGGGSGRGYSDMQVQQRGDSVVLSYRVQPGAKPRVEQKFNRLDVVFDVPGDAGQQAEANHAARQQQQQSLPAESRNPTAQQNKQTQAAAHPNPTPERSQPTATVDPAPQSPATTSAAPTPEPVTAVPPAAERQIAQAQKPATISPITTNQPAAITQNSTSLGALLIRNWALLVVALAIVGLGLVITARRKAAPAPVEGADDSGAKLDAPGATRAKEATARALRDASSTAQASTLDPTRTSTTGTNEPVNTSEPVNATDIVNPLERSGTDVQPLTAGTALAGSAAVAKSKKRSKKEARQEARRKKKGAHVEAPARAAEPALAAPVVQETLIEEPTIEEPVQEEPAEVAQAVMTEEVAEVVAEPEGSERSVAPVVESAEPEQFEVAEPSLETTAPPLEMSSAEPAEVTPVEAETPEPVTEIEPACAPDSERVLAETHSLLEGEEYDRAVVGARDALARQMVAAELLSALAGRNVQRRERALTAFVQYGYFDGMARDLREADAPAERAAAARAFAHLGDRQATPLLVAALEDPVSDVRRAAVEALGALRDKAAIGPLEALLEREKSERNRIPSRVIRTAVEFCCEGLAETPAPELRAEATVAETQAVVHANETHEPDPTFEPEAAPAGFEDEVEAATVEVETAAIETAPEAFVEMTGLEREESLVTSTPFFDDDAGAAEATREMEPVAAEPSKELTPSAGEWFDFDLGDIGREAQPAAFANVKPEPAAAEPVFETSSGEMLAPPAAPYAEEAAPEAAATAFETRDIEFAGGGADDINVAHEPAAETRERGLAPFDELSTIPASIQQRIASSNPSERAAAIVELSHVDSDEAFQQICAAFDDESKVVRGAAARALHDLRSDRAESFTRALREATPERRREIGAAIAASGLAAESIARLTGESRERTYEAFSLLFLMAKAGEVQPLLRAIEGHPNNEVRLAVVKLLALSGQKEVLPAFRRLAVRGSLPTEVRSAVMEAIYQISSSQPTPA